MTVDSVTRDTTAHSTVEYEVQTVVARNIFSP